MDAEQKRTLEALNRGEWFGSLPEDLRRCLVESGSLRRYGRGQSLVEEGEPSAGLFALLEGEVHVLRWSGTERQVLIHVGGPGMWFGEIPALLRCGHAASAVAQSEVLALAVPIRAFDRLVAERPDLYPHLARLAAERYVVLMRQVGELIGLDKEALLRARLADVIDLRRSDDPNADTDIRIPQAELAALVGISRQTLNDLLKRLERDGAIEVSYRRIRVLDVSRLRGERARTEIFRARDPLG